MANEARTMAYVRERGYPVPRIHELSQDGTDLVMERVLGSSMMTVLGRRPWRVRRLGHVLAELHRQLHEIPAPDWVRDAPGGPGDRLVHLDLHPLNVILSPGGPIVIDWSNAARGEGSADVALTWALLSAGAIPAGPVKAAALGFGRRLLVEAFLGPFDREAVSAQLPAVVDWKSTDPHMSPAERRAMQALALANR